MLLPVHYHQVVFTIDHEINEIAYHNQKAIYDLLFKSASETLKEFSQRYLGGTMGFTVVLHTWGQQIQPHIHLHVMITGGALVETAKGYEWRSSNPTFLFPVVELSAAFRERFCDGLLKLHARDELTLVGRSAETDTSASLRTSFEQMVARMRGRKWEVYIQKPPQVEINPEEIPNPNDFDDSNRITAPDPDALQQKLLEPMHLAEYLGRYVHQSAISNSSLLEIEDGEVRFSYYDNRETDENGRGTPKEMGLPGVEFIRRILWHVLPKGYVRVRHYGLHASGCRIKLQMARFLLGLSLNIPPKPQLDLAEWLQSLGHDDPNLCPFCETGIMQKRTTFGPLSGWRLMLLITLGVAVAGQVVPREAPT